jgi:hypothetical protein
LKRLSAASNCGIVRKVADSIGEVWRGYGLSNKQLAQAGFKKLGKNVKSAAEPAFITLINGIGDFSRNTCFCHFRQR